MRARYPMTWVGVKTYRGMEVGRPDLEEVRVAHLPEQVRAPGFVDALANLTATAGHPRKNGKSLWVHALADKPGSLPALPPGEAWVTPKEVGVGFTGSEITLQKVGKYEVPVGEVVFTDSTAQDLLRMGARESSLGYNALLDWTPGTLDGESYDVHHILDPASPLVEGHPMKELLGPNHFAAPIWAGRGGAMSAILDGHTVDMRALHRAIDTARASRATPRDASPGDAALVAVASAAPRHRYAPGAVAGWDSWAEGPWGIAFWAADGLGLVWTQRDATGGVEGQPIRVPPTPVLRRFYLRRDVDVSGVSGTGYVAQGVVWPDGVAALHWTSETPSTTVFQSLEDLEAVHGHEGASAIEWIDAPPGVSEAYQGEPPMDEGTIPGTQAGCPATPAHEKKAPKIEVEVEIKGVGDAGRRVYAGAMPLDLTATPRIAALGRVRDDALAINIPPEYVAVMQPVLMAIEQGLAAAQTQAATAGATAEAAQGQVNALQGQVATAAQAAETQAQQIDGLKAAVADAQADAEKWRAHEYTRLKERAVALGVKIKDEDKTVADLRATMLRHVAPGTADAVIKAGPVAIAATLDAILTTVRPRTGIARAADSTPTPNPAIVVQDSADDEGVFAGFAG